MIKININNNKNGIENPVYVNRGPKCVLFFKQQKHAVIEYIENLNKEKQETNHEESKTKVEKKTKKKLRKRRKIYASSAANTSETSVKKKIEQLSHFSNDSENKNDSKSLQFQRKDEKSSEQLKKNNFELDRSTVRRSSSIKMRRSSSKSFSSTTTTTTSTSDMVQESSYESHQKETYNKQLQTEKGNSRRRAASLSFRTSFKRESLYTNRDACCSCENQKKTNFIGDRRIKKYLKMSSNESTSNKEREYKITTYTGVHRWAGTDASIYITLTGTNGKGKEHRLKGKGKYFEKGSIDTFTVKDQDLGFISKIHVRNDNKGMAPGWLLNKVVVKEDDKEYEFSYGNWLFKGKNYSLDADIDVDGFPVLGINPHIEENSENHHTDKFILSEDNIILRRGQTFKLTLLLARDYKPAADPFSFTLMTTKKPQQMLKTLVHVNEVMPKDFNAAKKRGKEWIFKISDATDLRKIEVEIFIPPTAMPGHYTVYVNDEDGVCYEPAAPVYILFNPWCPEDDVYMESEEEIKEYVLRQTGKVYVGSSLHPRGRTWHFGQFEEVSLLATLKMLEEMKAKNRDSPIHVSRFLTSKVNSIDNNGVLEGNWSGDYSDGHSPTSWISTTAILEKYLEANEPVKYGQCWVFSAIVVTVLRCLGIPCRSVTNFSSAHDSDGSCSNDKYLDENGEEIEDMSSDSVWNFHVWNDAWMARPDLQPGYGGWQAIDATPQERSQGLFQMGPAPLAAVKEGEIDVLYDVGFCLAEVNADSMIWEKNKETDEWEVIYRNKTLVGKLVCTKAVGNTKMEDVTECYKFKEGSVLERASIKNALLKTKNPAVKVTRKDISLEIVPLKKHISCGGDITIDVKIVNESEDEHPMSVMVGGQVIRYDGVAQAKLEMHTEETSVEGGGEKKIRIKVPASHYMPYMSEETQVRFTATGKVSDTSQFVRGEEIIDIVKPDLVIEKYEEKLRAGVESEMLVTFTNPLDVELTECEMYMDGTIIKNRIYFNNMENVAAKGKMEQKILYIPENDAKERKDKKVNISFTSKELGGVSVQHAIPVSPPCTCVE